MLRAARARLLRPAGLPEAPPPAGSPEATPADRWRRRLADALTFLRLVLKKSGTDGITQRAAALAFVTILALIPLLAAFTFVAAQLLHDYQDRVLAFLTSVLPYSQKEVLDTLSSFVDQAETLQQVGFLAFILVGLGAFGTIEETINRIWQVSSRRSLRAKVVSFTLLVFWGPLLIGSCYSVLLVLRQRPGFDVLFRESILVQAVPFVVSVVGLTMLYWQVPFTRVRFHAALVGGVTASVLLEVLRRGFTYYVAHFTKGTYVVYGSFALAILFMISLELAWLAVLLGTEVAYVWQHFDALTNTRGLDARFRESWIGLAGLAVLIEGLRTGKPVADLDRLSQRLGVAPEALRGAFEPLVKANLVVETTGEPSGYLLSRDPHELTMATALGAYERPV
ncbi:MAG TPA: YhjD/YihY/BrkB family envelope integrity protein, partial [Thermoanaerobaculia bacterium]|nr:YhjD/YihY/BrkB family envelope integrity protein [Thermoanaerobaculia bacterium]